MVAENGTLIMKTKNTCFKKNSTQKTDNYIVTYRLKCNLIKELHKQHSKIEIYHSSFRTVTQKSLAWFLKNKNILENHNERNGETKVNLAYFLTSENF